MLGPSPHRPRPPGGWGPEPKMTSAFKPTRRELNRVQYLARECELEMGVTARLGTWYGMHRPAQRAEEAFSLSSAVAARAAQPAIARAA